MTVPFEHDEYLKEKEVSVITTLSTATLQRMRANPTMQGPPWAKMGHRIAYPKKKLLLWLQSRERPSTSHRDEE